MDAHLDEDSVNKAVERTKDKVNGVIEPVVRVLVLGGAFVGGCVGAWKAIESIIEDSKAKATTKRRGKR